MTDRAVGISAIARRLDVSERHARRLVEAGVLPGSRVGARGHWRVPLAAVRTYAASLEAQRAVSACTECPTCRRPW